MALGSGRSAADALSLTLPEASRSRARKRRWRKPPPVFWFYLFFTCWSTFFAVDNFVEGQVGAAILLTCAAGWWWRGLSRIYNRLPPVLSPERALLFWVAYTAACVALIVTGQA